MQGFSMCGNYPHLEIKCAKKQLRSSLYFLEQELPEHDQYLYRWCIWSYSQSIHIVFLLKFKS